MEHQETKAPAPETSAVNPLAQESANFEFQAPATMESAPSGENVKTSTPKQDNQTSDDQAQQTVQQAPKQNVASVDQTAQHQGPVIADDVDVIEKEWIDKAKQIVNQNKADPREQKRVLSILKADYMKKRYGKEVKIVKD